jgi:hypothetical protein
MKTFLILFALTFAPAHAQTDPAQTMGIAWCASRQAGNSREVATQAAKRSLVYNNSVGALDVLFTGRDIVQRANFYARSACPDLW